MNLTKVDMDNIEELQALYNFYHRHYEAPDYLLPSTTFDKEDLYYNYAYALYMLKDYKAYDYQELSYNIKDQLRKISDNRKFEEIFAKYNVSEVRRVEAQKQAESEKKLWLIGLSSTILIIALAFIAGFYRLRQKNLALKLSQNELLQEQKIEKLKLLSQRRILNATIDGKEAERKEIAETLHDSVSALLSSANLHLQATKNKFNGVTPVEVEKSQNIIIEKAEIVSDILNHPNSPPQYPAKKIIGKENPPHWILDNAAAEKIK